MKIIYLLAGFILFTTVSMAQSKLSVRGVVKNADGNIMPNASVLLYYKGEKDSLRTVSNDKGAFIFENVLAKKVSILVSYIGYKTFSNNYDYTTASGEQDIFDVVLNPGDNTLEAVTLESNKVQIKEDTVSYVIDSTMYRKNDNVEEVLKKLPGVTVDKEGTVTAQGKQVTKVKVNGKEFFGGDVTTATRELNADMVDKIQIIDDYGDQSAFTGIKDGDPSKTLNIQLKKDKNHGYFGNVTAGAGTEGRYVGSVSVNKFNNNQQISILGNINNTNSSTFNFGGGAIGSMIGGMVRSMGIGKGGGGIGSQFNLGNSDGIAATKSIGLNYRNEWGPKVSAYGSYSFSNRGTTTVKDITEQNTSTNTTNTQHSSDYTVNNNHRFSFNLEYKIDSFNYLKFTPSVTYNKTTTDNISDYLFLGNSGSKNNDGTTSQNSHSSSPNLNGNLLFNHRFHKRGRTLSVNLSAGKSSVEGVNEYQNLSTIFFPVNDSAAINIYRHITQDNNNNNYGMRASFIEPLSKKKSLEFNYAFNRQFTGNDQETFDVDPVTKAMTYLDTLSNIYDNVYTTNKFGVNFRTNEKKYNYTVGLAVQPATIKSNSVTAKNSYSQHLVNYFPVVRFAYNFSRSRSFNVNYNGSTNQPSYTQLQPVAVPDNSNQLYTTVGNPGLKPEFTNTLSMRYNNFDFITGNVFFGNISISFTKDKIVNNVIDQGFGRQETRYLNADGYYTAFGFYNFSKPIQNRKYVFNYGGNLTYNNNISFIDSAKNKGRNWLVGQRFATDVKIKKWLETTIGVNYSLNSSKYSLKTLINSNTQATAWTLSHSSRLFLPKNWKFSYDIDKSINTGYASNVNSDPLIINATLEKALFKKQNASVKLQAFDMLNESVSINRSVVNNSITDTRTNKLGRYFLLSFVFRLNKFSGQAQGNSMMPGMPGGNMRMMAPPGM